VQGAVAVSTGVGFGLAAALGWKDSEGFNMVGASGEMAAGLQMGLNLMAGR
jgi:hypothetical protein